MVIGTHTGCPNTGRISAGAYLPAFPIPDHPRPVRKTRNIQPTCSRWCQYSKADALRLLGCLKLDLRLNDTFIFLVQVAQMNKLFQSSKKLDRSNRESARNGESRSKQPPRVTFPTFGNDSVIKEDGDGNIDNRLLLLRIQEAFLPALQLDHQNPYEYPQEQVDKTIPPVLREARLLVQRYEILVEKFKEQNKQSNGHSYNKFDADLERARAEIKAKDVDIFKLQREHDRIYSDMRSDHRRTLEEQRQKWHDHVEDLKDTHRRDLNAARTDGNGWYARSGQLEKELKKVQYQNQILAEQNQRVEGETHGLREKQRNHDAIIQQLHDKYRLDEKQTNSDHQVAIQSVKDNYEAEIQRVGASGRRAGEALREDYEGQIAVLKVNYEDQIGRLMKEQTSRIQRLQKDWDEKANRYEAEKMQLREDFEDRKAELGRLHDEAIEQLEAEKSQLREDAQTRETELREDFEARQAKLDEIHAERMAELDIERKRFADEIKTIEDKLTKAHAQETDRLKRDIQSRNKAFISRDTFVPVTDGGLKSAFFDIVREVDTISRLKWAFNNSPWTDTFQSQITDNPKRLQKQILQDTIWGVFFECIFCSPFRIFGEEGLVLETQWNEAFGKCKSI